MAYMDQDLKAQLLPGIQSVLKKYRIKATIGVRHNSTLIVTLRSGALDLAPLVRQPGDRIHHYNLSDYTGECGVFLQELIAAMNTKNYRHGDSSDDTLDVGYYLAVLVGNHDRPYEKA